jgi:hypothetical protein
MRSASTYPSSVESTEVADVECIENTASPSRKSQLLCIGLADQAGFQRRDHNHTARAKGRDEIAVHRVLIDIDLKPAHRNSSTPVLLFQSIGLLHFGLKVRVDLCLIGVIVG